MKKLLVLIPIVTLFIGFFVVGFCIQADFDGFSGIIAQQSDGTIYLSKQEKGKNTIIQMDKEGRLMMQYSFQKKKGDELSYIKNMFVDEKDQLYLLKETKNLNTGNIVRADILRVKSKFTPFPNLDLLYRKSAAKMEEIVDFTIESETLFYTSIESNGKILKTRGIALPRDGGMITADAEPAFELQKNAPTGDSYSETVFMGGKLYALLKSGNLAIYSIVGKDDEVTSTLPKAYSLTKGLNTVSALCGDREIVIMKDSEYPAVNDLTPILKIAENNKFLHGTQSEMCKIYVGNTSDGNTQINCTYTDRLYAIKDVRVSPGRVLQNLWMQLMVIFACTAAIVAICYIRMRSNTKSRAKGVPTVKMVLSMVLMSTILGSGLICVLTISYKQDLIEQQSLLANTIHGQITNGLLNIDTTNLHSEMFLQSEDGQNLAGILQEADDVQSTYKTKNKILTYVGGEFFNLMGDENVALTSVISKYSKEYLDILIEATESRDVTKYVYEGEEGNYLLTISPISGKFSTVSGVLITEMSMDRLDQIIEHLLLKEFLLLIVFLIAIAVCTTMIANRIFEPILKIPKILLDTVQGRGEETEIKVFEKSYVSIYRALNEVNRVWMQRMHEQNNRTSSYYRFVPRKIQQLLMRNSITDVSFGDSNNLEGIIVTVTIRTRENLKLHAENGQFILFVNRCFSLINTNMEKYNGILLSGDFNISKIRMLYKNYKDALDFTIAIQDEMPNYKRDENQMTEIFATIHAYNFFYGIAGSENQVFPFMVSQEADFISGLRKSFQNVGNKIIVTEEIHKNIYQDYSTRYIGYVDDKVMGKSFKLYEVLNAYNAKNRVVYEKLTQKLEEGIDLFYKNDFYLARGIFSSILYECPADNIARWYLFACDKYFHLDKLEVSYDLLDIVRNEEN